MTCPKFFSLKNSIFFKAPVESHPCQPSPCGPNSQCREYNGQAVCSCLAGYLGNPPTCRPECIVNSECRLNEACSNQKCINPCTGTCGIGAKCNVINHRPICSCAPGLTGDPFTRCHETRKHTSNSVSYVRTRLRHLIFDLFNSGSSTRTH